MFYIATVELTGSAEFLQEDMLAKGNFHSWLLLIDPCAKIQMLVIT